MEREPKRFIARIVEYAALFALSAFLLRLGICYLSEIRWVLLIATVLALAGVVGWRIWKHRHLDW